LLKITCAATRSMVVVVLLGAAPGGGEAFRSGRSGPPIHTATSRSAIWVQEVRASQLGEPAPRVSQIVGVRCWCALPPQ
jgi:hypothetical protein